MKVITQSSERYLQQELPRTLRIKNFLFISGTPIAWKKAEDIVVVYFVEERDNNKVINFLSFQVSPNAFPKWSGDLSGIGVSQRHFRVREGEE